ncbi:MAG: hypothetical protein JRI76_12065 [Deltaproteobacteria bacterium]|nr:hypothetical protein [Deltaproteobacteria bacterium]MBW2042748.1 hypothetical protein [Deltaproteobacteria bacterium]
MKITITAKGLRPFLRLLQTGMILRVPQGTSVRETLVKHFGMDPAYLENRIQTLFLNGKPVDDLDAAVVAEGSVLALSAAMPGLVGATLRRGSYLAAMRQCIEAGAPPPGTGKTPVRVTVKLFNMVAKELGPERLTAGIVVDGSTFHAFLKDEEAVLRKDGLKITVDACLRRERGRQGGPVSLPDVLSMDLRGKDLFLRIDAAAS